MAARKKTPAKKSPARKKAAPKPAAAKKARAAKESPAAKKSPAKAASRKGAARKAAAAKGRGADEAPKRAEAPAAPKPAAAEPAAPKREGVSSLAVNLGHVFSLRPRVETSFRPDDLRAARQLLQDESYTTLEEAARAVAEKALELTRDPQRARRGR